MQRQWQYAIGVSLDVSDSPFVRDVDHEPLTRLYLGKLVEVGQEISKELRVW